MGKRTEIGFPSRSEEFEIARRDLISGQLTGYLPFEAGADLTFIKAPGRPIDATDTDKEAVNNYSLEFSAYPIHDPSNTLRVTSTYIANFASQTGTMLTPSNNHGEEAFGVIAGTCSIVDSERIHRLLETEEGKYELAVSGLDVHFFKAWYNMGQINMNYYQSGFLWMQYDYWKGDHKKEIDPTRSKVRFENDKYGEPIKNILKMSHGVTRARELEMLPHLPDSPFKDRIAVEEYFDNIQTEVVLSALRK